MQVVSPEDTTKPEKCKGDFVKVMDGDCSLFRAETKYCGKQEPAPFTSTGNKLCVKFFSDESQTAQGFSASYEAVDRPANPGGRKETTTQTECKRSVLETSIFFTIIIKFCVSKVKKRA